MVVIEKPEAVTVARKLGTALYTHYQRQKEAEQAEKAVEYLVEQGVLEDD